MYTGKKGGKGSHEIPISLTPLKHPNAALSDTEKRIPLGQSSGLGCSVLFSTLSLSLLSASGEAFGVRMAGEAAV